jgi:DNA gyrase subunit A
MVNDQKLTSINITDKTGNLIAIKTVMDNDDLMIINKSGITIRMNVDELRIMGRATQGVRLIKLDEGDEIASVAKIEVDESESVKDIDDSSASGENTNPDTPESDPSA